MRARLIAIPGETQRQVVAALTLLLCFGFFYQPTLWNDTSRYDLVVGLVDHGTTRIDSNQQNTGDKAYFHGHYYSDKEPGTALLGIPVYAGFEAVRAVDPNATFGQFDFIHGLAFFVSGIPTVALVLLLFRFVRRFVDEALAWLVALGYGLGTIAFPFATLYFGHAAAAFFTFATFFVLNRLVDREGQRPMLLAALAGVAAGWAVLVDISTGAAVLAIVIYALAKLRRVNWLLPFLAGGVPAAIAMAVYNWASFGSPLRIGYMFLANPAFAHAGLFGIGLPHVDRLMTVLVGPRGLFVLSPWLLVAAFGFVAARGGRWAAEARLAAVIVFVYLLLNAGNYRPIGGASPGPRYLLPALPFAAVLAALAPARARTLLWMLVPLSALLVLMATLTNPTALEGVNFPLKDQWLPSFVTGYFVDTTPWLRWGLADFLPLLLLLVAAGLAGFLFYESAKGHIHMPASIGAATLLLVFVLTLGTPIDPLALADAQPDRSAATPFVKVRGGGGAWQLRDGQARIVCWAQIENDGADLTGATVRFTVYDSNHHGVWSAWANGVSLRSGERQIPNFDWIYGSASGQYSIGVEITRGGQTLAREDDLSSVTF